jgi:hypothetical protein
LEAVKRVPHDHEVEVAIGLDVLGPPDHPPNIADSASAGVGAGELDGLRLLINCAHLGKPRRETERKLARATREVE